MKNTNSLFQIASLPLALSLVLTLGCSDLKQNPLAGKGEAVENAQPPQTKPEIPKPIESDALRIDGPEVVSFREGESGKVTFVLRSLLPDYVGEVSISNLAAFPGASFNAATGEFIWTPANGTVFNGYYQEMVLHLEGVAQSTKANDPILITHKEVRFVVQKVARNPIIKSIEVKDNLMRENSTYYVKVVVQDPEGTGVDSEKPRLVLSSGNYKFSLAPYITEYGNRGDLTTKEWTIDLKVNLSGVELTDSVLASGFELVALNRYGLFSAPSKVNVNVATDFGAVDTTIEATNEVLVGEKNVIPFMIFDQKAEAVIGIKNIRGLPAMAELKCNFAKNSLHKCRFTWTPDQKELMKVYTINMDVELSNRSSLDSKKIQKTISFNVTTVASTAAPLPNPGLPDEGTNK